MAKGLDAISNVGGAALLAAIASISGCVSHTSTTPLPPSPVSPAVRGAESGLEIRWWVLPDDGDVIARALTPYEGRPTPIDGAGREAWRANGLRVVAVPVSELATLQARFQQLRSQVLISDLRAAGIPDSDLSRVAATMPPAASTAQEQWLGEIPRWTDAVRGPQMGPGTGRSSVIKMDAGPLALGPGRLRLLLRAWSVPTQVASDHAGAGLRLELAPQFEQAHAEPGERDLGLLPPLELEEQGLVLSRLVLGMTLDGSDALVLVAARPDADWAAITAGNAPPPPPPSGGFGPPNPQGVTLGEAMLSTEPAASAGSAGSAPMARGPAKAVIVLVPHVRDRFELVVR